MTDFSKPKRKINLLIAVSSLHIGGLEVVIKNLVHQVDKESFNVTISCSKTTGSIGEELRHDGYEVISFDVLNKPKVDYLTFFKMLNIVRQKKIDIIHTHTNDALANAAVCKLIMPRLRLIHTFHFGKYSNQKWREVWIELLFSRISNCLIAVGEVQRKQIKHVLHLKNKRIGRLWNGVPINNDEGDSTFRKRLGFRHHILIGTICTLTEQKGLFDLLSVATHFRHDENKVQFVIVGGGPLLTELEIKKHQLGLENIVTFVGWVPDAGKKILPVFDIFFQPSLWEALSIVILEAMAAGKPIVATNVGENSEVIGNEVGGLIVEPTDIGGMAISLKRLINDPALRDRLGSYAKQKAISQFAVEHMTRRYENIYREEFEKRW